MSLTGNYTPLNLNTLGSLIQNQGFRINPIAASYMGSSTGVSNFTMGSLFSDVPLIYMASQAIRALYSNSLFTSQYAEMIELDRNIFPALTFTPPASYTREYSGELASFGFLRLFALQAHKEFYINNGSYSDFVQTFDTCESFKHHTNKVIDAFAASQTYLDGVYSNMDDLVTGDISGVSLSLFYWGQDLIRSGRAIDLSSIDTFGNPENLLRTLQKNRALTKAVNLALITAGFSSSDIDSIVYGREVTQEEQKRLYAAFSLVMGNDLNDALIPINCQTQGLETLADLLNPKKLFPGSYKTLTVPQYNTMNLPTNSKTYYLLYNNDETSSQVVGKYGTRLESVYPMSLASVCDAFSVAMMQIKHIKTMNIEKFSQVVANLEVVNDLGVNGTHLPTDQTLATNGLDIIAKGSGENGRYTSCDFFGCMSGLSYDWVKLKSLYLDLDTATLTNAYTTLHDAATTNPGDDVEWVANVDAALLDVANAINYTFNNNVIKVGNLNGLYVQFAEQLQKEQDARDLALRGLSDLTTNVTDIYSFIQSLNQHATQTEHRGPVQVLEAITDTNTTGGNSLIGGMRETRNALRMGLVGAEQDNEVGIEQLSLPKVNGKVPTKSTTDPVTNNRVDIPLVNFGPLIDMPVYTGGSTGNGSLGTSSETTLIPTNLDVVDMADTVISAVITPDQAINQVIICNCDCWDNLA